MGPTTTLNLPTNSKIFHGMNDILSIPLEFSRIPGPRTRTEGPRSAEEFNEDIFFERVQNAINKKLKITVILDGSHGYGTSFLEQVFGGAARMFGSNTILQLLEIVTEEEPYLKEDIISYIKDVAKYEC